MPRFRRIAADPGHEAPLAARVDALNRYLFNELGFFGNREHYDDPRNSCLNEVLDRRTGIPITLALVYIEVARRAGLRAEGVNFPGHFLVRALNDLHTDDPGRRPHRRCVSTAGRMLNEHDCRLAAEASYRRGSGVGARAAGPSDAASDPGADAAEPQAALRALAIVSASTRRVRSAADAGAVSASPSCAIAGCSRTT